MNLRDQLQKELDLEDEARGLGAARYRQSKPMPWRETTSSTEEEASLPPGRHLLRLAVAPTAEAIRAFIADADSGKAGRRHSAIHYVKDVDPEEIAYLTIRTVVNAATGRRSMQSVSIEVANALVDHLEMLALKERNKPGYLGLMKAQRGRRRTSRNRLSAIRQLLERNDARLELNQTQKLHIGSKLVELFIDATGLFVLELEGVGVRSRYVVRPAEAVMAWLERQHARCELLSPLWMPMVVRPKRYRTPFTGGYFAHRRPKGGGTPLMRAVETEQIEALKTADLSLVYDAVNHVQETPWRINRRILELSREVWDGGGSLGGLPPREGLPLPGKPADINTNPEALTAWKRGATVVYETNASNQSKRLAIQQKLWMAEKFVDEESIYFPHALDFRGRIYPVPATGPHPQSDDFGKALLEFAEGAPLGTRGAWWLAIHIANLFGVDKVPFEDRVAWTYDHAAELIDSALDPLDGQRFWATADSPWCALAAIIEFVGFLDEGPDYVSHIAIPLDGSNSGLQHFSAMLRDPVGALAVNLVPSNEPHDIYASVAAIAQSHVDADPDPRADPWRGGKVTRKIAKRPTMTFVYSATRFGMQDMIVQTLYELDADAAGRGQSPHLGGADNYDAANYLSYVLWDAITQVVSSAEAAMRWLRDVARVASEAGKVIRWDAPDGLPILQAYRELFGHRIQVHWRGGKISLTLAEAGKRLSRSGMANGIAPNFVHSLDAAHLRAVARRAKERGIRHLAVIHDSFGTHAANTDALAELLRETFVDQYEENVLANFRDQVASQLPEELAALLPPVPEQGEFDLRDVLESPYIFA